MPQQPNLILHPSSGRKAAHLAVGGDDAVAGDDDGDGVAAAGGADGAGGGAEFLGDAAVGADVALRDALHDVPDQALEGGAFRADGQVEGVQVAGEIGAQLPVGLRDQRVLQRGFGGGDRVVGRVAGALRLPAQFGDRVVIDA